MVMCCDTRSLVIVKLGSEWVRVLKDTALRAGKAIACVTRLVLR